jgi:hypothetical protein
MARQRRHASAPSASGGRSRALTLTIVGVVVLALLAVVGIVALLRGGGDDTSPGATSPSPSASASGSASPSPTAPSGPVASAPVGAKPAKRSFQGSGNRVLTIRNPTDPGGQVLVVATHSGGGKFGIVGLDATQHESSILVNGRGAYAGTTLLDARGTLTRSLSVKASGPWTVKIKPVSAATSVALHAKGTGDDVLRYTGPKGTASVTYRGRLTFIVQYATATEPLVNAVGSYFGQVPIAAGPVLVTVTANGPWTIKVAP